MSCEEESEAGKSGFSRTVNSSLSVSLALCLWKRREIVNDWSRFIFSSSSFSTQRSLTDVSRIIHISDD